MLTELKLKNFKCFSNSGPIKLSRITLLTGANGTGKSSAMQALLLLAQSVKSDKDADGLHVNGDYIRLGNYSDILCSHAKGSDEVSIDIKSESNGIKHVFSSSFRANGNETLASFRKLEEDDHNYIQEASMSLLASEDGAIITTEDGVPIAVNQVNGDFNVEPIGGLATFSELKSIYYLRADRHGPRESEHIEHWESYSDIGTKGEYVFNVLYNKGLSFIEEVRSELSDIMGGASLKVSPDDTDYRLLMNSADGTEYYKPINVGFAYSYVLPIVVAALLSKEKGKIFIENPEAHLHPSAQSRLMHFLSRIAKEKDLQIIIETHSDHILNACLVGLAERSISLSDLSVYYFRTAGSPVQLRCTRNGRVKEAPEGFFDQMDMDLDKLLEY